MREPFAVPPSAGPALDRLYRAAPRGDRQPACLYQGFRFSTGAEFPGYSSDGREYDSYRKLPFLGLDSLPGKRVLDLGANLGFFSLQAAVHGAAEVISVEQQAAPLRFARALSDLLGVTARLRFVHADLVPFVMAGTPGPVDVAWLLSVVHQLYPHLRGAEPFLARLASLSPQVVIEIPVAHPHMALGLRPIRQRLRAVFPVVRLRYGYKAYSPGYRAIFACAAAAPR